MPSQEYSATLIHRGLNSRNIEIRVARSRHHNLRRGAGFIGSHAVRGGTGGSDPNQQSSDSHGYIMRSCGSQYQVKTR
jgi:hypothetical protein